MEKHDFDIEKIVDQINIDDEPRGNHKDRLRWEMLKAFNSSQASRTVKYNGSSIMNPKIIKYAAAAMVLIAVGLSVVLFDKTVPTAYALQDTIEAYSSVRSLHTKSSWWKDQTSELWVQCDDYGRVNKFRLENPHPVRCPTTTVYDGNVFDVWKPHHNLYYRLPGQFDEASTHLPFGISEIDPKQACERLYEQQEKGEVILEVNQPDRMNEPIVITVTYPEGSLSENWKKMLYIDQATKLVKKQSKYEMQDGEYKHVRTDEYFDYNQQIDPKMFSLAGELPDDVIFVDQSDKEIGVAQGDMTDEEIAVEVGKQYIEARIAEDYEKAGLIFGGYPALMAEQASIKVHEITEIGQARADTRPDSRTMIASFKILGEENGYMIEYDVEKLYIKPVYGQPGRWMVSGLFIKWDNPSTPDSGPIKTTPDITDLSMATYNGLVAGELMQKWLLLDPVGIRPRGEDLVPSKEAIDDEFAAYHINVSQFEPTVTIGQNECKWSLIECEYGHIDFGSVKFKDELVLDGPFYSYIWSQVNMPDENQAVLEIRSTLPLRIWLNGELVHDRPTRKDIDNETDQVNVETDQVNVNFKKGNNQLVVKFVNSRGYWGFSCRLLDE